MWKIALKHWVLPGLLVCAIGRADPGGARAEDPGQADGEAEPVSEAPAYRLPEIVVRSTRIRQAQDDPSSFTTVIVPEQSSSQFHTAEDLLSHTSGVTIKQFGGLGQYSTVSIRGSSAEQVLVLLDGVRLNTGEGGSVDFSTIPLESIERIEVIRGGGTTLYGSDAVGGVVNILTKRPRQGFEAAAALTYGSLDTTKAWVTGSGGLDWGRFLLSVTHFQSRGDYRYETPQILREGSTEVEAREGVRENNDFVSDDVLCKADLSLSRDLTLTVSNDFFTTARGQPGTIFDPRLNARQDLLRNLTTVKLEQRELFFEDFNASLGLFNRYDSNHFRDPTPGRGAPGLNPIDTTSRNYAYGLQIGGDCYRPIASTKHLLGTQFELRQEELRDRVQPWEEGYGNPSRRSLEWRLQDEVVLAADRVSFIPALRYENSTDFGSHATGKIGLVVKPRSWLHIKSNIENSYRKPSFSELYFPDQGFIKGNPSLEAERGIHFDAGVGLDSPRLFFQTAYFRNWIEESIMWLPVSFWTVAPVNTGPVRQWGIETELEWRPLDVLLLTSNYTFLHAVTQETGEQQDGRPRHTVNFKASLKGRLGEAYTELQYLSEVPVRFTRTAKRSISPRTVVDLGFTVNLLELPLLRDLPRLEKVTLGLEIKNLADVSVYDAQFFPLPGRMWFLTVQAGL